MAFGLSDNREESGSERRPGNRPDCAYFLLLGLCGAAFLLTIGGILTYIAFNPSSIDTRPHSPLSHIPHFHHHWKHHDRTEGHYFGHFEQHIYHHDEMRQQQHHHQPQQHSNEHNNTRNSSSNTNSSTGSGVPVAVPTTLTPPTMSTRRTESGGSGGAEPASTLSGENGTTPGSHLHTTHLSSDDKENKTEANSSAAHDHDHPPHQRDHLGTTTPIKNNSSHRYHHPLLESNSNHHQKQHPHPGLVSSATHHHHEGNTTNANGEYQAKESLALAIIGGLCLTCGVLVTIVVGVFALKYDCDHEPEPNIAFLRLRSEMSLNFDPSKNNYELLMPATSSTTAGVGSTHSIHPGGMPRC